MLMSIAFSKTNLTSYMPTDFQIIVFQHCRTKALPQFKPLILLSEIGGIGQTDDISPLNSLSKWGFIHEKYKFTFML